MIQKRETVRPHRDYLDSNIVHITKMATLWMQIVEDVHNYEHGDASTPNKDFLSRSLGLLWQLMSAKQTVEHGAIQRNYRKDIDSMQNLGYRMSLKGAEYLFSGQKRDPRRCVFERSSRVQLLVWELTVITIFELVDTASYKTPLHLKQGHGSVIVQASRSCNCSTSSQANLEIYMAPIGKFSCNGWRGSYLRYQMKPYPGRRCKEEQLLPTGCFPQTTPLTTLGNYWWYDSIISVIC